MMGLSIVMMFLRGLGNLIVYQKRGNRRKNMSKGKIKANIRGVGRKVTIILIIRVNLLLIRN